MAGAAHAQQIGDVYTVSNYPVEARAANAVAAKDKALEDGQKAAFRSLMKRLVPVTAYNQLARLSGVSAANLVSGVSVRSERNSATDYIASLDFAFQAEAVKSVLASNSIPYVDEQAEVVTLVPVTLKGDAFADEDGRARWRAAWSGLDLAHTLTPVKLDGLKPEIHRDTIRMLLDGDGNGFRIVSKEYQAQRILIAVAEPDPAAKKMQVTIAGVDAVGPILLKRTYRIPDGDVAYASELAAVVALGVLEGRWKAMKTDPSAAAFTTDGQPVWSATGAGVGEPVQIFAEFERPGQWDDIRTQLLNTPGVEDLEILTVSERTAALSLRFPGGFAALANAVGAQGLRLINSSQGLVLRSAY
jgi:hypothetical protein